LYPEPLALLAVTVVVSVNWVTVDVIVTVSGTTTVAPAAIVEGSAPVTATEPLPTSTLVTKDATMFVAAAAPVFVKVSVNVFEPEVPVAAVFIVRTGTAVDTKFAVTASGPLIVRVCGLVTPESDPANPEKAFPVAAVAVTVTAVPLAK